MVRGGDRTVAGAEVGETGVAVEMGGWRRRRVGEDGGETGGAELLGSRGRVAVDGVDFRSGGGDGAGRE